MAIIGIDLGTTNSLACCWRGDSCALVPNSLGEYLTPSVVSVGENGEILTGKIARERLVSHPGHTAGAFKQFMGTDKTYDLAGRRFRPEDLSSFILRRLKEDAEAYLGEGVEEAVVSVPAYFNDTQRTATKIAGKLAGLRVDRIINEPSAAALAYRHEKDTEGIYLVFDFGGGTLDISIVDMFGNIVDIVAVAGDNHLGGGDIDVAIRDAFLQRHPALAAGISGEEKASLLKLAEQSKIALTENSTSLMVYMRNGQSYSMPLDNKQLGELCAPMLARMRAALQRALRDAGRPIGHITDVILVGGSCRMPLVREYVRYLTEKQPLSGIDPDCAVAVGVGLVSGIKNRDEQIRDMILTDICPFTLGVKTVSGEGGIVQFSPIIPRNTALPASMEEMYTTTHDGQRRVKIEIYQGESIQVEQNLYLGMVDMAVPRLPAGGAKLLVRFTYDINGILEVNVHCPQSGETQSTLIVSNARLTEADVEQRLKALQQWKMDWRSNDENRYLIAKGERLYQEHSGPVREQIGLLLARFQRAQSKGANPAALARMRRDIGDFFTRIDHFYDGLAGAEPPELDWEEDTP